MWPIGVPIRSYLLDKDIHYLAASVECQTHTANQRTGTINTRKHANGQIRKTNCFKLFISSSGGKILHKYLNR